MKRRFKLRAFSSYLGLSLAWAGCSTPQDPADPGPTDAELETSTVEYCRTRIQCSPGSWEEPEQEMCIEDEYTIVEKGETCRRLRYDFQQCVIDLDSCIAIESISQAPGTPCQEEFTALGRNLC